MLAGLLDKIATLSRQAAGGGATMTNEPTWATQASDIPVGVWSVGAAMTSPFYRPDFRGTHVIATDRKLDAKPGDRITVTGQSGVYYLVEGDLLYDNGAVSPETLYLMDVTRKVEV